MSLIAFVAAAAFAGDLQFGYSPTVAPDQKPFLTVTAPRAVSKLQVVVTPGGGKPPITLTQTNVAANKPIRFEWARDPSVTEVEVEVLANFADGSEEEMFLELKLSYGAALSVDLSKASADVQARTLSIGVSTRVDTADIVVYGAHKAELDRRTVPIGAGPGTVEIPWVGSPSEAVLLDVTVHAGASWAGFTYSPWFLDIPHEDVLFDSDQSGIDPVEEPKLQATLTQLREVIDQYGDVVPVKLYIAGCTDTVGDAAHNDALSRARAKAIATWLRAHGYDKPIYYHGFGERWLADPTGDGVPSPANRRAVYMVSANPPPPSAGVPAVSWTAL